jgi:two-component system sensor kinase
VVWKLAEAGKIEDRIERVGPPLVEIKRAMAVRKGDAALLGRLNRAVVEFRKSEAYGRIYSRWYGAPPPYWSTVRVLSVVGIALAVSLVLYAAWFLVWRYLYLRRTARELQAEVAARTEDVRRHAERLEMANEDLEAFAYSVSHDLRVPLRAVDGFSRILLEEYAEKLDAEGKRLLGVVRDNASKMGRLIESVLYFSRAGRLEPRMAEIDMESLVREAWKDLAAISGDRNPAFDVKTLPKAWGDRAAIGQVVTNLLGNAIKFTRGREQALIEVGGHEAADEVIYYVKDNGAGFDMQYAGKLFGVFQRLHREEEFEGTGVGLAIVKRILAKHGGRVWAEGKVDAGATFYFALPGREHAQGGG